jgi:lipoprotein-anchoring transpeptidase ErfK/SrfK
MRFATLTTAVIAALLASGAIGAAHATRMATSTCTPAPPAADPTQPAPAPAVVSYPVPSSTAVTKTSATLHATVDTAGQQATVAFELGDAATGLRCTGAQLLPALAGPRPVTAVLRSETPGSTVLFRLVVTTAAGQVVGADQAFTTAAAPARLAPGTTMLGIRVGYLTPTAAQAKVQRWFARPLTFTYQGNRWKVPPTQLGASADVAGAVARALAGVGSARRTVPVHVSVDQAQVAHYVDYLDGLFSRQPHTGSVARVGRRARVVSPQAAIAVQKLRMEKVITRPLESVARPPIEVQVTETQPTGPGELSIVIRLGEQSLTLYKDGGVVLQTPVTTGRPALPTPVGSYDIAWRRSPYTFISPWPQGNPYYYPPAHVRWAMYFYDNDFLHDSYEPSYAYGKGSNLGPYASHGCVHVPANVMQVLYTTVPDHTPVIVVDA